MAAQDIQGSNVKLSDRYDQEQGCVFITGMQAVARIFMTQKRMDSAAGLNTAGFVSGYRGSPLGTLDTALARAGKQLEAHDVVFRPGINEELAATAVNGSQQIEYFNGPKYDGVFAAWYGKGPGVDRAGDALKHGNLAGTAKHGGVLVFAGDDHPGKSSTTAHQSEQALLAAMIPILYPANVEEYLRFGAFGYALSRYSGLWVGFKCVNETADSTFTARLSRVPTGFVIPERPLPPEGLNLIVGDSRFAQEARAVDHRLPAAQAFARANNIDEVIYDGPRRRFGVISAGKAYLDTMEALDMLGIDEARAAALGVSVLKLGLVWPVEPGIVSDFSRGLTEVLVCEEKRAFIETQVKDVLYHLPGAQRPDVTGKSGPSGDPLLIAFGELSPTKIAIALGRRLRQLELADSALMERIDRLSAQSAEGVLNAATAQPRTPYYCSGCPHNTSTKLPENAIGLAGIGCHVMASMMPQRKHTWPVQMGGEGVNWTGAEAFVETGHVFQNLGDGTYNHSGILAIRAAVSAASNITYKLLFNDAVAMTGGQPVEGQLSVGQIAAELLQEGVTKVVVVAEDPEQYGSQPRIPAEVEIFPRDELERVQSGLPSVKGVTVLIYDQVCAAEKRRRRKRNQYPDPAERLFINEAVCEGCGDCGVKSNCVSLQPVETEFGRKRRIDQSSCNKDFSCVNGFCPSFVTVSGGELRKATGNTADAGNRDTAIDSAIDSAAAEIPFPVLPPPSEVATQGVYSILIAGVGGTGVVTIGAVLGMAVHLQSKAASVMDMTGLSQKNGAVYSHLRVAPQPQDIRAATIDAGRADLLLGCDMIAAAGADAMATVNKGQTAMVINGSVSTTAAFTYTPDLDLGVDATAATLKSSAHPQRYTIVSASEIARRVLGDSIAANMLLVGVALQRGLLPVSLEALERAIELNGVAVTMNLTALKLGRWMAQDPAAVENFAGMGSQADTEAKTLSLEEQVALRYSFLQEYQNTAYANRYRAIVDKASAAETQ